MAGNTHEAALNLLMDDAPMTRRHWWVWFLSAMGIFLDGFDLFIIGVALPLIKHDPTWNVTPAYEGILGVAALVGAVVGASVTGYLTDRYGRKRFYIADLGFVIIAAVLCGLAWDMFSLVGFRFLLGIAIGADYPISASYISEFVPARIRGRMLIAGFMFQAFGMIMAALSGLAILLLFEDDVNAAWRFMLVFSAIPAAIVLIMRLWVPESIRWLLAHGKTHKAAKTVHKFVPTRTKEIEAVLETEIESLTKGKEPDIGWIGLFKAGYLRRTVLVSVPWFLMDIATYGIGIFTPVILARIVVEEHRHTFFGAELKAVKGAAFVDLFLVAGFVLNMFLVEKLGRMKLQLGGFLGMAAGLSLLGYTCYLPGGASQHLPLVFAGFILFNLTMNMGPNATTYMLPVELYPTRLRASAHGFAAAAAKTGATVGVLLLPILDAGPPGIPGVMFLVAGAALLGFFVTLIFRFEPMGKTLDEIEI